MVKIYWTTQAETDLKEIFDFIAQHSYRYAHLQIDRLRQRTQILKSQINAGKPTPEYKNDNVRELVEGNYRIIYLVVDPRRVDILLVHHGARDLAKRIQKG